MCTRAARRLPSGCTRSGGAPGTEQLRALGRRTGDGAAACAWAARRGQSSGVCSGGLPGWIDCVRSGGAPAWSDCTCSGGALGIERLHALGRLAEMEWLHALGWLVGMERLHTLRQRAGTEWLLALWRRTEGGAAAAARAVRRGRNGCMRSGIARGCTRYLSGAPGWSSRAGAPGPP